MKTMFGGGPRMVAHPYGEDLWYLPSQDRYERRFAANRRTMRGLQRRSANDGFWFVAYEV